MKKLFFMLLCVATITVFGQGSTLYQVNVVKPKAGMKSAFEASWKLHLDKFHKTDDKRTVLEVISGSGPDRPDNGSFVIVEGPFAYADMDKTKSNAKEHGLDLEKNIDPKLEPGRLNLLYRWADTLSYKTLSYKGDDKADKYLVTATVVKDGKMAGYLTEVRRAALINAKINSPLSYNVFVRLFTGSSPTLVHIRKLKDGFKELEANYFQMTPTAFMDAYVKEYGQEAWDKRIKLLVDDVVSRKQHFRKLRADLSSK